MNIILRLLLFPLLAYFPVGAFSMQPLGDEEMAAVDGQAIAFVWEDFRWLTKPTSYFEQVGSSAGPNTVFKRGDLRWYGVSTSATGSGTTWTESAGNMNACPSQGYGGLGCPRGGRVPLFAAHDNPYIFRVNDYPGAGAAGSIGNGVVDFGGNVAANQTVLELLAPKAQDYYRFSFWGELEVGKADSTNSGLLKTQTIIQGSAAGSELRLFKFTNPAHETLAIQYLSHLQGDFRFSAAQSGTGNDVIGVPVVFDANEGLHFRNVNAYVPLGQLYYQALVIDVARDSNGVGLTDGNFVLEIPSLPNELNVYTRHYSLMTGDTQGFLTARNAQLQRYQESYGVTTTHTQADANYFKTHGDITWGNWVPCQGVGCPVPQRNSQPAGRNAYNSTDDGIFFAKCNECDDFYAHAYRVVAVDLRSGSFQCWDGGDCTQRYANQPVCNPGASGTAMYNCGYGGYTTAKTGITNRSQPDPSMWFRRCVSGCTNNNGLPPNTNLPVRQTAVANLGDSRISGLNIQSFSFTSYAAQY